MVYVKTSTEQKQKQQQKQSTQRLSKDFVMMMDRKFARREPITPCRGNGRLEYKWIFTLKEYYEMKFLREEDYL